MALDSTQWSTVQYWPVSTFSMQDLIQLYVCGHKVHHCQMDWSSFTSRTLLRVMSERPKNVQQII